ncbi:sulfatase-like hydrolase/transferase [bacterium]|nr:sulfatase-like hydrolase/transferase [bacterium]
MKKRTKPHWLVVLMVLACCGITWWSCSNRPQISQDLLVDFPSMHKDCEDVLIVFGRPEQGEAKILDFGVDEYHDDRFYSWLLGHEGRLDFYLAELARVAVLVSVKPFVPPGKPLQRLKMSCNGVSAGDHVLPLDWSDQHYSLPDQALRLGWNTLTFECRYTCVPARERGEGEEGDNRELGVAFEKLQLLKQSYSGLDLPERRITSSADSQGRSIIEQSPGTRFSTCRLVQAHTRLKVLCALPKNIAPDERAAYTLKAEIIITPEQGQVISSSHILKPGSSEDNALFNIDLTVCAGQHAQIELAVERVNTGSQQLDTRVLWRELKLETKQAPSQTRTEQAFSHHPFRDGRDLVVLLIDTLRSDALGCYGQSVSTSPWIDRFAKKALQFCHGRAQASWTRPSVASLFTGLLPEHHGVLEAESALSFEAPRFFSHMKRKGYCTAAVSANPQISEYYGFARDFDRFIEMFNDVKPVDLKPELLDRLLNIDQVLDATSPLLDGPDALASPFCLYLHIMDPHSPYAPPEPYARLIELGPASIIVRPAPPDRKKKHDHPYTDQLTRQTLTQYYGEIRYTDHGFRRLLTMLEQYSASDSPLIVLIGDHGEEFWEHGGMGHGFWIFEETLNVPVLIGPLPEGQLVDAIMEVRRLFPDIILGAPIVTDTLSYDHTLVFADEVSEKAATFWHTATDGRYKCTIRTRAVCLNPAVLEYSFYNLAGDPLERYDLASQNPVLEAYFIEQIRKNLIYSRQNSYRAQPNNDQQDETHHRLRDQLKILGYTE